MVQSYQNPGPAREEVDALQGAVALEFGTDWCGHCQASAPFLTEIFSTAPIVHIKVEDGPGRRLGRSYKVKLWPTVIFLKDGVELARLVRPLSVEEIADGVEKVTAA